MGTTKNAILKAKINNVITELLVKTDAANVYVDDNTTLATKLSAIIADIATKASTQDLTNGLAGKANSSHTHAQSEVTGLTDALALLSSKQEVTNAIDALRQELLGDTPVEAYNTFTELAAYIETHEEAASALTAAVGNKADKATTLAGYGITDAYTKTDADKAIDDKISAASGGVKASEVQSALNSYKTSNDTRVDALEAAKHTHSNKTVLDGISSAKVAAWDAAQSNAQEYADGLNTAMDTRVDALEADKHSHSNKTVLDGITSAKVTAWDGKGKVYYNATEPSGLTANDLWVQIVE